MRVTLVQHRVRTVERQTPTQVCPQVGQHAKSRRRAIRPWVRHELSQVLGHKREAGIRSREPCEITDEHNEVEGGPVRSCPLPRYQRGSPDKHGSIDRPKVKSSVLRQHRPSKILLVHLGRTGQRITTKLVSAEFRCKARRENSAWISGPDGESKVSSTWHAAICVCPPHEHLTTLRSDASTRAPIPPRLGG